MTKIKEIIGWGTTKDHSDRTNKRIRMMNMITIIVGISLIPYFFIFHYLELYLLRNLTPVVILSQLIIPVVNRAKFTNISRFLLPIIDLVIVFTFSSILGPESKYFIFYFPTIAVAVLFFDLNEKKYSLPLIPIAITIISADLFFQLKLFPPIDAPKENIVIISYFLIALAFAFFIIILYLMEKETKSFENELFNNNERLAESEKRFKDIAQSSSDWIFEMNSKLQFTYASIGIFDTLGYDEQDIIGNRLFKYVPKNNIKALIAKFRSNGEFFKDLEFEIYAKNGNLVSIITSGIQVRDSKNKVIQIRGVAKDITEKKKLQAIIEEESNNYKSVYYNSFNAISTLDNNKFIGCNEKVVELLNAKNVDQILNTLPSDLSPEFQPDGKNSLEKAKELIAIAFEKGFINFEWTHKKFTGELFPVNVTLTKIYNSGKPVLHCVWKDLTIEKEVISKLKKAKEEAEISSNAKSEFLANMSHEIRTPMNGVIGLTDLLLKTGLNSKQLTYANSVKNSGESLLTIINDILDFSKIEAGKLEIENIDFDFINAMENFEEPMQIRASEKGINLFIDITPDLPKFLVGDPGRIRQVLTNLVGNAIKFTREGYINVICSIQEEHDDYYKLLFEVSDTGIGISEKHKKTLFEKFTQADSSITKKYGGTGLGLAISKQIVNLMGGDIGVNNNTSYLKNSVVNNTISRGSTFWFTINLKKSNKTKNIIEDDFSRCDCSSANILYISDNKDINRNNEILSLLTYLNVKYDISANYDNSFEKISIASKNKEPFNIILLDVHPENNIDTDKFAKQISNQQNNNINLIILSATGSKGDAKKYRDAGFSAYLTDPISQLNLHECFVQLLNPKNSDSDSKNNSIITNHTINETQREKVKVLIVEDNETNMFLATELLADFGYLSDKAWNGEEAIEKVQKKNYDLVFMDLQMPTMDGLTATKKIREMNIKVPIVAMTANAIKGDREICLNAGMNDYISKPIDQKRVLEVLNKWVEKNYSSIFENEDDELESIIDEINENNITFEDKIEKEIEIENKEKEIGNQIFNPKILMNILRNKKEKVKKICDIYIIDTPNDIKKLEESYKSKDYETAIRMAHTIKGSSANIGALIIQQIALDIEDDGKNNDFGLIENLLPTLKYEFYKLDKEIKKYFEDNDY